MTAHSQWHRPIASSSCMGTMYHADISAELLRRADGYVEDQCLILDLYRIRRRFALPLPIAEMPKPDIQVPGVPMYPTNAFTSMALEERIGCLGWAAQWSSEPKYSLTAAREMAALASWPLYCQFDFPDLGLGHVSRIFWTARTQWNWITPELQAQIDAACERLMAEAMPLQRAYYGENLSVEAILQLEDRRHFGHNIALIGTLGMSLVAHLVADFPIQNSLNNDIRVLTALLLKLRETGFSEGVCYDGHVLGFLADWMTILPEDERAQILADPRWGSFFHESLYLSAPGDLREVAPLSDVTPHYSLHIDAQAKLHALQSAQPPIEHTARGWYLRHVGLGNLRSEGLVALTQLRGEATLENSPPEPPPSGALDAHYVVTLRTGWESGDVAVAIAASNSPMNHVRNNYGSLCIGTAGQWLIQTPGYQQYVLNSEREFTIGKTSRNTPLINNCDASFKAGRLIELGTDQNGSQATLGLEHCYAPELGLQALTRHVELSEKGGQKIVLVEDRSAPHTWDSLIYYWHGHPDAAWWVQDGWAMLYGQGQKLWFASPQADIRFADVQRLRGSRGQLTLVVPIVQSQIQDGIQWLFVLADQQPGAIREVLQAVKAGN